MKVVIVGCGPAGIVTAKSLLENADANFPFDPILLEQVRALCGDIVYPAHHEHRRMTLEGHSDIGLTK